MGLLEIFNKIFGNDFDKNVENVFRRFRSDIMSVILKGGIEHSKRIIKSIALVKNQDYKQYGEIMCEEVLKLYIGIVLDKVNKKSESETRNALLKNNSRMLSEYNVDGIMAVCYLCMANPLYELVNVYDPQYTVLASQLQSMKETKKINLVQVEKDDNTGLIPENPIYTKSIDDSELFLSKLLSFSGEKLSWKREGSIAIKDISGVIDIYYAYLSSGDLYGTLYLNIYGNFSPKIEPKGYKLIN